jgi:hypothetical protein
MRATFVVFSVVSVALAPAAAQAWDADGHRHVARAAARSLPADVPAFLRAGGDALAHYAVDADLRASRAGGPLRRAERAEHWLDLELLRGHGLPAERTEYLELLHELKVKPGHAGTAPYRIVEDTWALALALAEHRRAPDDGLVRAKVLARAGALSHFTSDLAQPLHTTIHYDGRAKDGRSPNTGIHLRVDALLTHLGYAALKSVKPVATDDPLARVKHTLDEAHARVDRVYALEAKLPPWDKPSPLDASVRSLSVERGRAAVQLTADLWLTAWRMSEKIELPKWYVAPPRP